MTEVNVWGSGPWERNTHDDAAQNYAGSSRNRQAGEGKVVSVPADMGTHKRGTHDTTSYAARSTSYTTVRIIN